MKERLERTLVALARRYASQLVPSNWAQPGDYPRPLPELARALANHNVLVLMGDIPVPHTSDAGVHIKLWADTYTRLYTQIARALFPSLAECQTFYADQAWPPIIILHGKATPLITVMAGYIAPFIAARQGSAVISEVELRGLVDLVLDELEASDLPRNDYQRLRDEAAGLVKDLLSLQVRQMPLTPAARPVFGITSPTTMPPITLPEEDTQEMPNSAAPPVPPVAEKRSNKRRPPVPDLPDDKK
jgi:hypothetical protein